MAPLKVKMIGTISTTLGISMYCEELANHLASYVELSFAEFDSLYPSFLNSLIGGRTEKDREYSEEGFQIERSLSFLKPWTWMRTIQSTNEHILHLQWWSPLLLHIFLFLGIVTRMLGRKVITTVHNVYHHESRFLGTLANKAIFRISDYLIVHSENNRRTLLADFHLPESRVFVIPHGLLKGKYAGDKDPLDTDEFRKKMNIPESASVILFLGHIRRYKGLDLLIRAFPAVREEHPDSILLIAGKPWSDWSAYRALIRELRLQNAVRSILGYIPDSGLQVLFELADVVVLPYRSFDSQSGIGLMSLEYAKAMIVTETGGLPDLVDHPKSLVHPGNVEQLSTSISCVIASAELRQELENISRRIRTKYTWDTIAERTTSVYREIVRR
jgi:glycosyltransferase involved in cell wall biosynthesis